MRKVKKFSEGGRAAARRDRRMADIEKDYQKALAKGKSEKEARAKRAQRIADTEDDYAKHTGADRTKTRAAEKAAEARLSAARRSPDKDMKPLAFLNQDTPAPLPTPKIDTPKVEAAPAKKAEAPRKKPAAKKRSAPRPAEKPAPVRYGASFGKPETKPKAKPTFNMRALRDLEAEVTRPKGSKTESPGRYMTRTSAQRQQAQIDELLRPFKFAKGGKIDGIAMRGKTRLKRKK